jgi:hypothetical protein
MKHILLEFEKIMLQEFSILSSVINVSNGKHSQIKVIFKKGPTLTLVDNLNGYFSLTSLPSTKYR